MQNVVLDALISQGLILRSGIDPVRKFPGSFDIRNFEEGVAVYSVSDILFLKFICEEVMAVHIELQTERSLGGDAQVTQSKLFVNKIKVIVEAFTLFKLKECLSRGLIMPGLISITPLHGRKICTSPSDLPVLRMISWMRSSLRKVWSLRINPISIPFSLAIRWEFERTCSVRGWEKLGKSNPG